MPWADTRLMRQLLCPFPELMGTRRSLLRIPIIISPLWPNPNLCCVGSGVQGLLLWNIWEEPYICLLPSVPSMPANRHPAITYRLTATSCLPETGKTEASFPRVHRAWLPKMPLGAAVSGSKCVLWGLLSAHSLGCCYSSPKLCHMWSVLS